MLGIQREQAHHKLNPYSQGTIKLTSWQVYVIPQESVKKDSEDRSPEGVKVCIAEPRKQVFHKVESRGKSLP